MKAEELRRFREQRGWSQGELGKRLGLNLRTIARYEKSKEPLPKVVELAIKEIRRDS